MRNCLPKNCENLRHPSAARHQTDFGSPKYRLSLRIAENRAGRRPVHTSNHRHRIRADPDAHHGQIIFCLHNTPFWEVYDLKHKKSSEIPRPTLTRRLEYALLRKPAYRLTRKLEQRYAQLYIRVLSNVDRFVTLCPGYSDEFEREIRRSGLPGCDFPRERLTAMLNPMLPTQEPAKTPKEKIVLYAGRFQRCHKRIDRLLKYGSASSSKIPNGGW